MASAQGLWLYYRLLTGLTPATSTVCTNISASPTLTPRLAYITLLLISSFTSLQSHTSSDMISPSSQNVAHHGIGAIRTPLLSIISKPQNPKLQQPAASVTSRRRGDHMTPAPSRRHWPPGLAAAATACMPIPDYRHTQAPNMVVQELQIQLSLAPTSGARASLAPRCCEATVIA